MLHEDYLCIEVGLVAIIIIVGKLNKVSNLAILIICISLVKGMRLSIHLHILSFLEFIIGMQNYVWE
jgi:hypothetical protein